MVFFVPYRTVRMVHFEHDYENTLVDNALGEQPNRNDLAFVQGMAGVNTVITFNDLKDLENIVVNKAELELRVAVLDGSRNDIFPPADQLLLFEVKEDGTLELIEDFTLAAFSIADIEDAIGGTLILNAVDNQLIRYSLNLSSHFQRIVKGEASTKLPYRFQVSLIQVLQLFKTRQKQHDLVELFWEQATTPLLNLASN
ncbi:MAG: DUF4270 domain-containing protein [Saprospiraceae bacterium]|nr:DUF4270 domain-containing protein [Saprospiraceae bacterium]